MTSLNTQQQYLASFNMESAFKKGQASVLHSQGMSVRNIARETSVPKSTIQFWISCRFRLQRIRGSGRKKMFSPRDERQIVATALKNPTFSLRQIKTSVNVSVHKETIRRILKRKGIMCRKRQMKLVLSDKHKRARLQWAMKRALWRERSWERVVFSDEASVKLHSKDGRLRLWIRSGQMMPNNLVLPRIQCGGASLLIWGAVWSGGRSELRVLRSTMNTERYLKVLEEQVYPMCFVLGDTSQWLFQDDNAPPHRSLETMAFKELAGIRSLEWPSRSPDLSPIENVWSILKKDVRQKIQLDTSLDELESLLLAAWNAISQSVIDELICGMTGRVTKLLERHGDVISH